MSDTPPDDAAGAPAVPASLDAPAKIDFERADFAEPAAAHVACGLCQQPIHTEYWQYAGKVLCASCRDAVRRTVADAQRGATMWKAVLQGGGVALACGAGYAIVSGTTHYQLALVTIGIGWAVGRTIQKITRGFGSVKHQVLAVALTYFASTMGSAPDIVQAIFNGAHEASDRRESAAATNTTATPAPATPPAPGAADTADTPEARPAGAPAAEGPQHGLLTSFGILAAVVVGLMLAAPFLGISSGFSGILGLLIIFFGLRTAWRMTKGNDAALTGPHRVGPASAPAAP